MPLRKSKLKNAPLQEVIFELYWQCSLDSNGIRVDRGFDLAQGKFADKLAKDFPVHKRLIPENSPIQVVRAPIHQYWKGEVKWPVVQHGQGMIAINEVETGYIWEDNFRPLILQTLNRLTKSYNRKLNHDKVKLQYIDVFDVENGEIEKFMKDNLQTSLKLEYKRPGPLKNLSIQQTFELANQSMLSLNISSRSDGNDLRKSIVWTTTVERKEYIELDDIVEWVDFGHNATSDIFIEMLNPDFYASLDR